MHTNTVAMAAKKSEIVFDHACTHFIGTSLIFDIIYHEHLSSQCMSYTEQEKWFLTAISIFIYTLRIICQEEVKISYKTFSEVLIAISGAHQPSDC